MSIHAAGGVLWRPGATGPEVCLIHRPRYDDWSLPKGKLQPGEHPLAGAVREVAEETGVRGVPQRRLPTVRYQVADGSAKRVDYWAMRATDSAPAEPDGEADEVCWLPVDVAAGRLSYGHDVDVLTAYAAQPVDQALTLVRHASAGERAAWPGPDAERPLDDRGRKQADALALLLALCLPARLVSATPDRCRQTLAPLGELLDLPVEADPAFDEPTDGQHPQEQARRAADRLRELVLAGEPVAVCSQGKVIPRLLALVADGDADSYRTPKGAGWLLSFTDGRLTGADPLTVD